jgi:uncharacterized protein YggE
MAGARILSRLRYAALMLTVALSLLVPAAAGAQERTITVTGRATQEVPNDTASLTFSVTKERRSRAAALRVVALRLREVVAAVQGIPGVGPGDLTTGQIVVSKVRGAKPIRYRASEPVTVILHQPERAGEMVTAAIAAGATGSHGPRFFPGNPEQVYNDTLIAAFDQAKGKASALAARAGATLGPAINIEEGAEVVPTEAAARGPRSATPTPPVEPGDSTVTATVRVVFSLE